MNPAPRRPDDFNQQLSAALERKPSVRIAPDFAARVALQAAALPQRKPRRSISYGHTAAMLSAVLLLLTMFFLAPWTQPGFASIGFDVEVLAASQLLAISWWLTARRRA